MMVGLCSLFVRLRQLGNIFDVIRVVMVDITGVGMKSNGRSVEWHLFDNQIIIKIYKVL